MGRTEFPDLNRLRASLGWYDKGKTFNESEKALFGAQGLVRSKKCLTPPTLLETGFCDSCGSLAITNSRDVTLITDITALIRVALIRLLASPKSSSRR